MIVERSYLVRVIQRYEGDPPADWSMDDIDAYGLNGDHDQYVCDNWTLISDQLNHDTRDLLRDDDLEYYVVDSAEAEK